MKIQTSKRESNLKAFALLAGLTASVIPSVVYADSANPAASPPLNTSITTEKSFLDKLSEHSTLSLFSTYHGGALGSMGSAMTPNPPGVFDPPSPQVFDTVFTAGYKIQKDLTTGVLGHFYFFPGTGPSGQAVQTLDPMLFISKANVVDSNGFKLDAGLRMYLPVSDHDTLRPNHLATSFRAIANSHFETLNSKLTVGYYAYLQVYVPSNDNRAESGPAPSYYIYGAPYVNYQLSNTVAATLWVDLIQATRNVGTGFFVLDNGPVDLEPGISWDITKNITINPGLNIYAGHPTLATTSLQAIIIAKAF